MGTEGPVGSYNRANRSLTHLVENTLPVVLCLVLAGRIFAFPTFILTLAFAAGRIMHQVGYASAGYGGHALGFLVAMVCSVILQGLCLLAAAKNLGFQFSFAIGSVNIEL